MIYIADLQDHVALPKSKVRKLAEAVLKGEKAGPVDLSFAFVDDREMRKVNRKFLNHDYATDVLSFLLGDGNLLGEVVISTEYAAAEAGRRRIPVREELLRYVAHGVLHLLGYDDVTPAKKKIMWAISGF